MQPKTFLNFPGHAKQYTLGVDSLLSDCHQLLVFHRATNSLRSLDARTRCTEIGRLFRHQQFELVAAGVPLMELRKSICTSVRNQPLLFMPPEHIKFGYYGL